MFNTKINFIRLVRENFPVLLQERVAMQWNRVFVKPIRDMYKEFKQLEAQYLFEVQFNCQRCYLQDALNIRFDNALKRIHVVDTAESRTILWSIPVAGDPPRVRRRLYSPWDGGRNYLAGQFAVQNRYLFKALVNNTNASPKASVEAGDGKWAYHPKPRVIIRGSKQTSSRYVVFMPLGLGYDLNEFTSIMNTYRMVGLSYTVLTY